MEIIAQSSGEQTWNDNDLPKLFPQPAADLWEHIKATSHQPNIIEDYTPKKWRECVFNPKHERKLNGFGKWADWYRFFEQERATIVMEESFQKRLQKHSVLPKVEFIELHIQKGGVNPKTFDWWNVTESFDLDPPKFNEEEMKITLKFLFAQDEYVTVCLMSHKWERYYERRRVGTSRKMEVSVASAVSQFTPFIGAIVLKYDTSEVEYTTKEPKRPIRINATFFGQIAERLQVPRDKIGKFILDCCEVEFTKWDWVNDLKEHVESRDDTLFDEVAKWQETVKNIKEGIASSVPNSMEVFKKGFLEPNLHLKMFDYFLHYIRSRGMTEYARAMMHLSLTEDRLYDFSDAVDIIDRTHWQEISDKASDYSVNMNGDKYCEAAEDDENDSGENVKSNSSIEEDKDEDENEKESPYFEIYFTYKCQGEDSYDDPMELIIGVSHVRSQKLQQHMRERFSSISHPNYNENLFDDVFQNCFVFENLHHYEIEDMEDDAFEFISQIQILLGLEHWTLQKFLKFILDMTCAEDYCLEYDSRLCPYFWIREFDSLSDCCSSESFSGESADDGEDTLMDLDLELNEIKMEVEPDHILLGDLCARRITRKRLKYLKERETQPKRAKATLSPEKSQLRKNLNRK